MKVLEEKSTIKQKGNKFITFYTIRNEWTEKDVVDQIDATNNKKKQIINQKETFKTNIKQMDEALVKLKKDQKKWEKHYDFCIGKLKNKATIICKDLLETKEIQEMPIDKKGFAIHTNKQLAENIPDKIIREVLKELGIYE